MIGSLKLREVNKLFIQLPVGKSMQCASVFGKDKTE